MNKSGSYEEMFSQGKALLKDDSLDYGTAEDFRGAVTEGLKQLQNSKLPFAVTDLSPRQIMLIHKLRILDKKYPFAKLGAITDELAILLWSKNRSSRKEIGDILASTLKQAKKRILNFGGDKNNTESES